MPHASIKNHHLYAEQEGNRSATPPLYCNKNTDTWRTISQGTEHRVQLADWPKKACSPEARALMAAAPLEVVIELRA